MALTTREIANIKGKALSAFRRMLDDAINSDTLDEFLKNYGIELDIEDNPEYYLYSRRTKIYVIGELSGHRKDYILTAKKLGICEDNLEFKDYSEMKSFNTEKFRNTYLISDIICGPIPHRVPGVSDYSSLIAEMKTNPNVFPKVFIASSNGQLKLTISNFKQAIIQTRFKEKFN